MARFANGLAGNQRHVIAINALHQTPPTRWQIIDHLRVIQTQRIEIDDVDISHRTGCQTAAILEAKEICGFTGLALHHEFQGQALAALPIPRPMRQHEAWRGSVANHAAMRTTIGKAKHRCLIHIHFPHDRKITRHVIRNREIKHPLPISTNQEIIAIGSRILPGLGGEGGNAALPRRFIIRRIAQFEHIVPTRRDLARQWRQHIQQPLRCFFGKDFAPHLRITQPRQLLGRRQPRQRRKAFAQRKGIERRRQPQNQPHRAPRDLRGQAQPLSARIMHALHQALPPLRIIGAIRQQEPNRALGGFRHFSQPAEFRGFILKIAQHAESAAPGLAHGATDGEQFLFFRIAARHQITGQGLVLIRARCGEAEGTGFQRFLSQSRHGFNIIACRVFAIQTAITHHVNAQGMMRELRSDIQRARHGFQSVKIFGEAFPIPFEPFGQRNTGDVFHAFHQINQRLMVAFLHRRKANAAIAKQQSRHAMPG